jgi:D-alanyl-D-alanine carboxypeptidase (penicillin-binding protein 5/6)
MKFLILIVGLWWSATAGAVMPLLANAPDLSAKSYLLYDFNSGQVLLSHNADTRIDPASLSKLMTAYLAFDAIKHDTLTITQEVTVPDRAAQNLNSGESRMLLRTGQTVAVRDLLRGLIVQSGNDAAITLAVNIAGSELGFVDMMNQQAVKLGMKDTHFTHSAALSDPQHYSTAHDLVRLAAAIVRDYPQYYPLFKEKEFTFNNVVQANRNRLLWLDEYADGLKTGQNETAGFCLIGSALRDKRRLISVVLGTESDAIRTNESQKLLNYGFQNFDLARVYKKDQAVTRVRVWKGTESEVEVGFRKDMYLTFPKGQQALLTARIETQHPVLAPIHAGQTLGTLKLFLADKPYAEFPLTALGSSAQANVFARGWDGIRLLIQEIGQKP